MALRTYLPAALLAVLISVAYACKSSRQDSAANAGDTTTIFDFGDPARDTWYIQNDGVMGGKSKGAVAFREGMMRFSGNTVTAGGGFTSVIANRDLDLSPYRGLEMRVRGGGRDFEIDVSDGTYVGRREVSRRAKFPTSEEWAWRRIAFADLEQTAHGEPVDVAPVDLARVRAVGFYIIDGRDGDFWLEVDEVRAWR